MTTRRAFLGASAVVAATGAGIGRSGAETATCPAGRFVGERLENGVSRFLGIRYGVARRFQRPESIAPTDGPIRAMAFGSVAPQRTRRGPQSEDCLTLNIWTPAARRNAGANARLPIMVYLHGGAFAFGSASDPLVDGSRLAGRGVVVVSVNHRLNALGYLYLARLDPRFPDSGNAGQHDLVLALRWIRDNIASFGGDNTRITAFGDSGGGGKVTTLLAMPTAAGLIRRAVTMSGQQVTVSGPINATRRAQTYLSRLKIAHPAALLEVPVERLIEALDAEDPIAGGPVHLGPVLDMRALTRHPFWPDAHPQSLGVPMMTGNSRDEMRAFYDPDDTFVTSMSWANLSARITAELPVDLPPEWLIAEYRRRCPSESPADLFFAITTAGRSWRGQIEVAEARARASAPVWSYQIDFTSRTDPRRRAFHCIDLPLVFGNLGVAGAGTGSDQEAHAASRAMQDRFVNFARSGQPGPGWPAYSLPHRSTMIFDVISRLVQDPRGWQRELFARAPYLQPGS